jgi:hypothetical protein
VVCDREAAANVETCRGVVIVKNPWQEELQNRTRVLGNQRSSSYVFAPGGFAVVSTLLQASPRQNFNLL